MQYHILRDNQQYGPYSLGDLQRYVASGNILLTDLCRSEGMADWVPVSQVIGNIPVPVQAVAQPAVPSVIYPNPPGLHWGVVVLLGICTCGIFGWIWGLVQAAWMKKVMPSSKAIFYFAISICIFAVAVVLIANRDTEVVGRIVNLCGGICFLVGAFSLRSSLEEHFTTAEPYGLSLSGVMTFFFSVYYFQYHLTRINEVKKHQAMTMAQGA